MNPDTKAGALAGLGSAGGTAIADVTGGLDVAAQVAGDVLRGIFGGLPWEMGGEAAATLAPVALDVLPVIA